MKLYFLGTCAGTEPMPGWRHSSVVMESNGRLFWFDAGESCSITAHTMGLDLLNTTDIIISHCHMDHIGGLANLLWTIRKLRVMSQRKPAFGEIRTFVPNPISAGAVNALLCNSESNYLSDYPRSMHGVTDGELINREGVRVIAYHNHHLVDYNFEPWLSFSYRIEAEGKSIVYSGDVGSYSDLDPVIGDGCDAVLIETGHFSMDDAHKYLKDKNVGHVYFTHNGRPIMYDLENARKKAALLFNGNATICNDRMCVEI